MAGESSPQQPQQVKTCSCMCQLGEQVSPQQTQQEQQQQSPLMTSMDQLGEQVSPLQTAQEQQQSQHLSVQENSVYKNRLQEFTQKASLPLPVYHTVSEGGPRHAPQFRSTVEVDGDTYSTLDTFPNRKAAEQGAAKLALEGISKKIKNSVSKTTADRGFPAIYEDRVFCKSILHEYATKMNIEKPLYDTVRLERVVPVFVSSLVFDGVNYTGEPSVNKKEAEQLAARAVILSILAKSEVGSPLPEIVKSKAKLFSAVHECSADTSALHLPSSGNGVRTPELKERVSKNTEQASNVVGHLQSEVLLGQPATEGRASDIANENANMIEDVVSEVPQLWCEAPHRHQIIKPNSETFPQPSLLPSTVAPPLQAQTPVQGEICSGKRKARKNKKANKRARMQASNLPLNGVPSCSCALAG